jgi:hypothetical protein
VKRALTRSGSAWRAGAALAVVCLVAKNAHALESAPPSIWYRSSEGCPDGSAFLGRLHGAAEGAKLATAGDRIDFVVTLGLKDGHAFGQLERQTAEGRVAVRELEAPRCEEVADAVALTLTLALEPHAVQAGASSAATTAAATTSPEPAQLNPTSAAPGEVPRASNPTAPNAVAQTAPPTSTQTAPQRGEHVQRWLAGADATFYEGSLPDPLLGARLFVELGADAPWRGSSARVAAFFMQRARETNPDVDLLIAGGRLDACPLALFGPVVELRPCLALELGWERARGTSSTGVSDAAFWAAGSASARVAWHASRIVGLEAELGPSVPFTRYELVEKESGEVIHSTERLGFSAALGVFVGLP